MSKAGTEGDPFGVADDVANDLGALGDIEPGGEVEEAAAPKKKLGPGGLPMPAVIGIGAFAAFMIVAILIVVIAKVSGGDSAREVAMRAQAARLANEEAARQRGLVDQVRELQEAVRAVQDTQKSLDAQLKKAMSSQDIQAVEQRVFKAEAAVRQMSTELATVVRRVGESQPFEADMYARDDLKLVSIGSGVARVVDATGREFPLQRGDKWDGVRVLQVRSDRRQVTFSDGSVVR